MPDLFLSHSSRDKTFVRRLADDLAVCQVDVWLDEWELQPGESVHDVLAQALARCRFVAIVLGEYFDDSRFANEELKQALARERRENRTVVIPILAGAKSVPAFLEDKLHVDLTQDYFGGIARLSGLINDVPRQHVEDALRIRKPDSLGGSVFALRYAGFEPYVVLSKEDCDLILSCGGAATGDGRVRFSPGRVRENPACSERLRALLRNIEVNAWGVSRSVDPRLPELGECIPEYDIVLTAIGQRRLEIIRLVRTTAQGDLREILGLVNQLPAVVASRASREEATRLLDAIERLGGQAVARGAEYV